MKINFKKYSFLIGFFLLGIIIYQLDLEVFYQTTKKINYQLLILALFLAGPLILTKAWRWNYLKKLQNINYRLSDSFLMYGVGLAIGSLTPGRLGEISKISYLKNDGYSTGQSLVSVVVDRLSDLFYLILFGYLGIILFFGFLKKVTLVYSVVILSIIVILFIIKKQFYKQLIKKIFSIIIPSKYQQSWQTNFNEFLTGLKKYTKKNYFNIFLITLLAWLIYYSQIYLFAKTIGIDKISPFYLIMAVTVSGFITLLPLSFLGIGTRDATLLVILSPLTDNLEGIILLSQLILLDFFIMGLIGVISWWLKPLPLKLI